MRIKGKREWYFHKENKAKFCCHEVFIPDQKVGEIKKTTRHFSTTSFTIINYFAIFSFALILIYTFSEQL